MINLITKANHIVKFTPTDPFDHAEKSGVLLTLTNVTIKSLKRNIAN